jgi:hypothetical protein
MLAYFVFTEITNLEVALLRCLNTMAILRIV